MGIYSRKLCSPLSNVLMEHSSPQFFYESQARLFSSFLLAGDSYWNGPRHWGCTSCTPNATYTGNIFSSPKPNTSNAPWKDYKWLFPQSPVIFHLLKKSENLPDVQNPDSSGTVTRVYVIPIGLMQID